VIPEITFEGPIAVMAPASNSTKTLQQNRPRPTVPRAVVPAIPLPYIQKRRQQQAAREKATDEAVQAIQTTAPSSPTPPPTKIVPSVVNGSSDSHATENVEDVNEPAEVVTTAPILEDGVVDKSANGEPETSIEEETMGKHDSSSLQLMVVYLISYSNRKETRDASVCALSSI
jgi:hypothetical protein